MKKYLRITNNYILGNKDFLVVRLLNERLSITLYEKQEKITQEVFNKCVEDEYLTDCWPYIWGYVNYKKELVIGFEIDFQERNITPQFTYPEVIKNDTN